MGLSAEETSSHLTMIVALVVVYGVVLGGVVMVFGWSWVRRCWRSMGFARRRWDRTGPVGTAGGAG